MKKILYSPLHHGSNLSTINRPNSRNSLNSRLSSSHNSLSVAASNKVDDSIFITQAMSHDALLGREIIDFYNVPIDSDIYALPVDFVKTQPNYKKIVPHRTKTKYPKNYFNCNNKKRRRNNLNNDNCCTNNNNNISKLKLTKTNDKRHSVPENSIEPMHMTLDEVKQYYHSLYSSSSDSSDNFHRKIFHFKKSHQKSNQLHQQSSNNNNNNNNNSSKTLNTNANGKLTKTKGQHNTTKKLKNDHDLTTLRQHTINTTPTTATSPPIIPNKKSQFSINLNLKQKFCSIFRFRKPSVATTAIPTPTTVSSSSIATLSPSSQIKTIPNSNSTSTTRSSHQSLNYPNIVITNNNNNNNIDYAISSDVKHSNVIMTTNKKIKFSTRALPPLPGGKTSVDITLTDRQQLQQQNDSMMEDKMESSCSNEQMDFATNLEKVKECGWYWGPISSEAAEKILSNEPDGSFIVRDSSDDHYIFSLSFKLSGCIRHVRIEQYQG